MSIPLAISQGGRPKTSVTYGGGGGEESKIDPSDDVPTEDSARHGGGGGISVADLLSVPDQKIKRSRSLSDIITMFKASQHKDSQRYSMMN